MRSVNVTWLAALALSWMKTAQCQSECSAITKTSYAVATTVTDISSFRSSLNSRFSTPGISWSGARVPYYSTLLTGGNGVPYTGIYYYDSHVLSSAGYEVISAPHTTISCPPTTTPTLPSSPTGSVCSPLGDHCTWSTNSIHILPFPQKVRAAPMGIIGIVHLVSLSPQLLHRSLPAPRQLSALRQLSVPHHLERRASLMAIIGTVHLGSLDPQHHHHQVLLPLPLRVSVKLTMITGTALRVSLSQLHPHLLPPAPRQSSMSVSHTRIIGIALQVFLSPQHHHPQILLPLLSRMSVRLIVIIGIAHQEFLNQRHRQISTRILQLYFQSRHQVHCPPGVPKPTKKSNTLGTTKATNEDQSTLKRTSLSVAQQIGSPTTEIAISSSKSTALPVSGSSKLAIYQQWIALPFIPAIFLLA
ncbi:unnamed protein product [Clonostachys chloroleuca]|uniref:Uncharacterized protein n=1 Tax=Clonostachys chloroleuca TaxID=1926264 RepID=A0AA35Q9A8_9HYPO|nr:unnamed protein product [Clonostachys chloroleuca]